MDFKDYKTFYWTDKYLRKTYSENILNKYYPIISFLYQNGFYLNCEESEIDEQMEFFNCFQSNDDFEDLKGTTNLQSDFEIGKKIIVEELYDILKNTTFCRKETSESPAIIKSFAETYWIKINDSILRIQELFNSKDSEIVGAFKNVENYDDIVRKIGDLQVSLSEGKKVLTWLRFTTLINIIYSLYIKLGKTKTDTIKLSIASNLNDEIYGATGGFNPNTGEIKCIIGSAVWDLKSCKNGNKTKIKNMAKEILDTPKTEEDKYMDYLERWYKGHETNDEYAQQIVCGCLLNGILSLLSLKHNLSFLEDIRNSDRADEILYEFRAIAKWCGIDKDYLLD